MQMIDLFSVRMSGFGSTMCACGEYPYLPRQEIRIPRVPLPKQHVTMGI